MLTLSNQRYIKLKIRQIHYKYQPVTKLAEIKDNWIIIEDTTYIATHIVIKNKYLNSRKEERN